MSLVANRYIESGAGPRRERGVVLLVALVLLGLMVMLGVSSMESSIVQEKMSANARDRAVAFENVENTTYNALGQIRKLVASGQAQPDNSPGYYVNAWVNNGGGLANQDTGSLDFWMSTPLTATNSRDSSLPTLTHVSKAGRFMIERMRFDDESEPGSPNSYQVNHSVVTVWAEGNNGAVVVTQASMMTLPK